LLSFVPAALNASRQNLSDVTDHHLRGVAELLARHAVGRVRHVGIVGGGVMGCSVAETAAACGCDVTVFDVDADAAERVAAIPERLPEQIIGFADAAAVDAAKLGEVRFTTDMALLAGCDFVIESAPEDIRIKQQTLAGLEDVLPPETVIGTNTSTIPIHRLAMEMRRPERLCGMHFFLPVWQCPITEIAAGRSTAAASIAAVVQLCLDWKRLPLRAPDTPGFIVNRLLLVYGSQGVRLLTHGADPEQIDAAAEAFGMRWGPLRMLDEVGLDTVFRCGWRMAEVAERLVAKSPLMVRLIKQKRLGRKTGEGVYLYDTTGIRRGVGPTATALIEKNRAAGATSRVWSDAEIIDQLLLPVAAEGLRLIEESPDERSPYDIDAGMIFGLGFPEATGGIYRWVEQRGWADAAADLARRNISDSQGTSDAPELALRRRAERGDSIYAGPE
jgi:3-hydroxyacyl-CoA dehydrogenase/enoyl-CoA hydratase/3-hydroxybutyryl-CoA epimerase